MKGGITDRHINLKCGYFDIRNLSGEKVNKGSISYKKLQFLGTPGGYLTEIRTQDGVEDAIPPIT